MMVQHLLIWSLKVSFLIGLMYGAYWLLFRRNTHFQLRRMVILTCLLLASIIPAIEIEVPVPWSNPIDEGLEAMTFEHPIPTDMAAALSPQEEVSSMSVSNTFSWQKMLLNIYLVGLIIAAVLFLLEILKLSYWYYFGARRTDIQDNVITHRGIQYPFSFWKWIFLPQGTDYDKDIWEIIEKHETAHLNQYHTVDMVFMNIVQCLFWYNPFIYLIQRELKNNHEALADRSVLTTTDFKIYAQALVKVSINSNALKLGHSFALISTLSKRITAMQTQRTGFSKTFSSIVMLSLILVSLTMANVVRGQEVDSDRDEILDQINKRYLTSFSWLSYGKLTPRHEAILKKLKDSYPNKSISSTYCEDTQAIEYGVAGNLGLKPLYFDKLTYEDKAAVFKMIKKDSSRLRSSLVINNQGSKDTLDYTGLIDEIEKSVDKYTNYIVFYESIGRVEKDIYNITEVDVKPKPIGGIETFVRAIALDIDLPRNIRKRDLPATIDFEVVINGGKLLTNIKLLTELNGSDEENKDMYLFFGQVHDMMISKVRELYSWKRGIKDGKEVRVRTTIAIPTKYM